MEVITKKMITYNFYYKIVYLQIYDYDTLIITNIQIYNFIITILISISKKNIRYKIV